MFEIDLSSSEDGEWFYYQDSHLNPKTGEWVFDPPINESRVRVRRLDAFIRERMANRKRKVEWILNEKSHQMERQSYFADQSMEEIQKDMEDGWDYAITGVEGFRDKKTGKEIECTRENKIALMRVPAFDRFIGRCFRVLSGAEEAEEKN